MPSTFGARRLGDPAYDKFRTGLTFKQVKQMMWSASEDSKDWRYRRRKGVLRYWCKLKQMMWAQLKAEEQARKGRRRAKRRPSLDEIPF